jgi:Domain of unknown function (DUF4405)
MNIKADFRPKAHAGRSATKLASGLGKGGWKKVTDLALYLVACTLTGTGLLLAYRLPHGEGHAGRILFLGYGRHEWGDIHTWLAYVAIFLVVVHLLLNWQWLLKVAASKHIWRLALGILSGLLVVGAFFLLPKERSEQNYQENAAHLRIDR